MNLVQLATACGGGLAAGTLGAAAGAIVAAVFSGQADGVLAPFDGAWLGTAFATPLGITAGWAWANKNREEELPAADCPMPVTKTDRRQLTTGN
jgi:hypothetical protein